MTTVPRPRKPTAKGTPAPSTPDTDTPVTPDSGAPSPAPTRRSPSDVKLAESVRQMYEAGGMLALGIGMQAQNEACAQVGSSLMNRAFVMNAGGQLVPHPDPRTGADKLTDAWMTLADRNPKVKAALRRFTEGGAAAEVIILHATILSPFLPGLPGLSKLIPGIRANGNGASTGN